MSELIGLSLLIGFIAFGVERYLGYPGKLQTTIGHPVQWMGGFIGWCDKTFNIETDSARVRRNAGILMLLALLLIVFFVSAALSAILRDLPFGFVLEALLATSLLAQKHLSQAVKAVADGLNVSIEKGRLAVGQIVGRETRQLDSAEISRAAVETLAENTSDGVIAPLFWLLIFGLPGIALYKAINTADSMVGHMSARHQHFGWASAKLDDLVNFIPARITGFLFVCAGAILQETSGKSAFRAMWSDAAKHKSPNAGWPEAAMAGALNIGLGGPRTYNGAEIELAHMGTGNRDLDAADIDRALQLYHVAMWVVLLALAAACALTVMVS